MIWVAKWGNYKEGELLPYLFTCPIPEKLPKEARNDTPVMVSLVAKPCDKPLNAFGFIDNGLRSNPSEVCRYNHFYESHQLPTISGDS